MGSLHLNTCFIQSTPLYSSRTSENYRMPARCSISLATPVLNYKLKGRRKRNLGKNEISMCGQAKLDCLQHDVKKLKKQSYC
jgi:hypothetical protein